MFSKKNYNQRLDIKLSCPQIISKHLRKHMENMYRARQTGRTSLQECVITPTHVFEIYRRFTHNSMHDAIYHMLAKILKFSTTKMHGTQDNQEDS